MRSFSRLEQASNYEVEKWLDEKIVGLTDYQKKRISDDEIVRFSDFEFYKQTVFKPVSILWRLTMPFFFLLWILLFIGLPFSFLVIGEWGYNQKFIDKFYARWMRKLNFDL